MVRNKKLCSWILILLDGKIKNTIDGVIVKKISLMLLWYIKLICLAYLQQKMVLFVGFILQNFTITNEDRPDF